MKIRIRAPYDLSALTGDTTHFSHLLAAALAQIPELPDFSDDSKIAVMTDFGGEHPGAKFNTYSFLILAYNKVGPFEDAVKRLRQERNILVPYSEFKYKNLTYGPRRRAMPEFLKIVDSLIHGAVVTVAIERGIDSLFGDNSKEGQRLIRKKLADANLGIWKGATAERALRICHGLAILISLLATEGQRVLWYCDNDAINQVSKEKSFENLQQMLLHALSIYNSKSLDLLGFAKSLPQKSHLDDLLSITDLAAGVIQDVLAANENDGDIQGGEEKAEVIKWLTTESKTLSKITFQITKLPSGEIQSQPLSFCPPVWSAD